MRTNGCVFFKISMRIACKSMPMLIKCMHDKLCKEIFSSAYLIFPFVSSTLMSNFPFCVLYHDHGFMINIVTKIL